MLQKLRLHSQILPALDLAAEEAEFLDGALHAARNGVVFDCRQLNAEFLDDTGSAAFAEGKALRQPVRLPFNNCYFEFGDELSVVAYEVDCDLGTKVEFFTFPTYPNGHVDGEDSWSPEPQDDYVREFADGILQAWGEFPNGADEMYIEDGNDFFVQASGDGDGDIPTAHIDTERGAHRLLGVLTLLNEHLIATEIVPDQCKALNANRAKKGRLPLSAETRVLTINTAAVRRAVRGTTLRQHESPRLHWRRGHWRTLHRYSEFESRTWVRRCLVGDPERGFIHKDYRVVWEQPMLQAN